MKTPFMPQLRRTGLLLGLSWALAAPTLAHVMRIEPTADQHLVILFGDAEGDSETSPGLLDELTLPIAWTVSDGNPALTSVRKEYPHFRLLETTADQIALAETRFPAFQRGSLPVSWPQFYQRWHPASAPAPAGPALTFDIVPAPDVGQFRVYFRGLPLAGANVGIDHRGDGGDANLVSDENGYITYLTEAPGLVLMTSNHKEALAGFTRGRPYEVTSHNTALTWIQPQLPQ